MPLLDPRLAEELGAPESAPPQPAGLLDPQLASELESGTPTPQRQGLLAPELASELEEPESKGSSLGAVAKGFLGSIGAAASGVGRLTEKMEASGIPFLPMSPAFGTSARVLGDSATEAAQSIQRPEGFIRGTVPEAIGSGLAFAGTGLIGRAAGVSGAVSAATVGASSAADNAFREALTATGDEDVAWQAFVTNAAIGTTEGLPIGRLLDRIGAGNAGVRRWIIETLKGGIEEASQEGLSSVLSNAAAKTLYDENRELFQGVAEGGGAGGIVGVLFSAVAGAAGVPMRIRQSLRKSESAPVEVAQVEAPSQQDFVTAPEAIKAKKFYHGTNNADLTSDSVDASVTQADNLFGQGFYLTDSAEVASGYAKGRSRRRGQPTIYEVSVDPGATLDLSSPASSNEEAWAVMQNLIERIDGEFGVDENTKALAADGNATFEDIYSAISEELSVISHQEQVPTGEISDILFESFVVPMRGDAGIDALTHIGGRRTGGSPHQVLILLDPQDQAVVGRRPSFSSFGPSNTPASGRFDSSGSRDRAPLALQLSPAEETSARSASRSLIDTAKQRTPQVQPIRRAANAAKTKLLEIADSADERGFGGLAKTVRSLSYGGLAGREFGRRKSSLMGLRQWDAARNTEVFKVLGKALRQAPEGTDLEAYRTLIGESEGRSLPSDLREVILDARDRIDQNTRVIRDEVLRSIEGVDVTTEAGREAAEMYSAIQQTLNDNLGKYVARFYKADHVNGYRALVKKNSPDDVAAAIAHIQVDAAKAGEDVSPEEAASILDALLVSHTDPTRGTSTGAGVTIPRSRLLKRKNIAEPIRRVLGEVKDAGIVIEKTLHDQAAIIENFRFLRGLAEFVGEDGSRYGFDKPNSEAGAIHRLGDDFRLGPMAGKFVTAEVRDALTDHNAAYFELNRGLLEKLIGRPFRKSKTVYNPGTHARNVIGNTFFAELANASLTNRANHKYYSRAFKALRNPAGEDFRILASSGALGSQYFQQPSVEKALRNIGLELRGRGGPFDALQRLAGTVDDKVTGYYIAEDQWFRAAAFFKQIDKGSTHEDAAMWVNLFFPDYDTNPGLLRDMEATGFVRPFLSFFSQMPRIAANGAIHNPIKMATVLTAGAAAISGLARPQWWDDEEKRKDFRKLRTLMPDYSRAIAPWFNDGPLKVINVQNMFPFADLGEFAIDMYDNPIQGVTDQMFLGTPVLELIIKMMRREDSRGYPARRSVEVLGVGRVGPAGNLPEDPTLADSAQAAAFHLVESISPPLIVGTGARGLNLATGKSRDKYDRGRSLFDETLGIATGIRPIEVSWDVEHRNQAWAAHGRLVSRIAIARETIKDETATPVDRQRAARDLTAALETYDSRIEEIDEALKAAKRLGGSMTLDPKDAKSMRTGIKSVRSNAKNRLKELGATPVSAPSQSQPSRATPAARTPGLFGR